MFGYEVEHYDISQQIAELELFPSIRKSPENSIIVAAGTSCRHQIADGLGVKALHPAEVFAMAMGVNGGYSKAFEKDWKSGRIYFGHIGRQINPCPFFLINTV